jgi:phytoene desaturase
VVDALVVGGGVGGMATALRLRLAGHQVTLVERNGQLGGKLALHAADGFAWDTGPSLLTLPEVFDDLLAGVGTSLGELVGLRRLDPVCRYRWPDGSGFDHPAALDDALGAIDTFAPGEADGFHRFLLRGQRIWETARRTFFAGPLESPLQLVRRMRSPLDLLAIDPLRTLDQRARATFGDPRLVQWAGRYATYSGSSPFAAPATLGCIPWIEQHHGAWHVEGGLGQMADALTAVLAEAGVEVLTGQEVAGVEADSSRVLGIRLADGQRLRGDVVVANVDAHHLYQDLLPDDRSLRRVRRAPRSTSGFALLLGVEAPARRYGLAHHNVFFSPGYDQEYASISDRAALAEHPTVYVAAPDDPALAPPGCSSWFVLVNTPPTGTVRWEDERDRYAERVLDVLVSHGVDVRPDLVTCEAVTPEDLASRTRSWRGSIYGTSSDGRRAAFARPANRGPRRGLYLVGGSAHPGGGLPLVAMSGAIVATMVQADLARSHR